ncbi:MAG TPA: acetoacetate--CoA ligase [Candidatus Deferrimicrobium sp.]|nr:acetoacetate--CoA ligase [Candidatus Deferrimicrobium sp.]
MAPRILTGNTNSSEAMQPMSQGDHIPVTERPFTTHMKTPLWKPSAQRAAGSNMARYMHEMARQMKKNFESYVELYEWSVTDVSGFWKSIWELSRIKHSVSYNSVLNGDSILNARWFEGARLNFAENLLHFRDDHPAIVSLKEQSQARRISYRQLYASVARCAAGLKELGVRPGDRVAAYIPNCPEAVVAMLAVTSLGAIWSSCSPDFGLHGVLDRFGQIAPKILITADGYRYNGKAYDCLERIGHLQEHLPTIEHVVVVPCLHEVTTGLPPKSLSWDKLLGNEATEINFAQLPFDHPVYIMYSSGTTGAPKCIVHGAGGTLLQHFKEHTLHTDLRREDVITYYTTCGWMMWNWLVSALQIGATIVLYDGSPSYPGPDTLWKIVEQEHITVFGTSARFLSSCRAAGREPSRCHDLSSLKTILSTGSPLSEKDFEWVYSRVKADVLLSSISGGTDIISCFMLGNPMLPVYAGEIQCRGLGMKVEAFDADGIPHRNEVGELVCLAPFPCRPVCFWNDPDNSRYLAAYFEQYPGVWRHGDYITITDTGGVIVHGRSDATLNPGGVRIGTAEIYAALEGLAQIRDSVVVGQRFNGDVRVILFVILAENVTLTEALQATIRETIRRHQTPRHVPAKIIAVADIPYTLNGKKVELAVTRVIHGEEVPNRQALANPDSLGLFVNLPELAEP